MKNIQSEQLSVNLKPFAIEIDGEPTNILQTFTHNRAKIEFEGEPFKSDVKRLVIELNPSSNGTKLVIGDKELTP